MLTQKHKISTKDCIFYNFTNSILTKKISLTLTYTQAQVPTVGYLGRHYHAKFHWLLQKKVKKKEVQDADSNLVTPNSEG